MTSLISSDELKELLVYNPETGIFRWRVGGQNYPVNIGDVAGYDNGRGYIVIGLRYRTYRAHRLAWLYSYGEFPRTDIDHINGDRCDNRLINLRLATRSQNLANTRKVRARSGCRGVTWDRGYWVAAITINYKRKHLGRYRSLDEAAAAYRDAAESEFGEFAHHIQGRKRK